ncbi:hypothetical protein [Sphingomonas bacterium]|uniref:hypothetical protein n=1 Tax=Sphingomonas bacterium TaxID=1895847 RepID=UPI0015772AFF|nr:hypothetical protein [Sphingomonas bacterium]
MTLLLPAAAHAWDYIGGSDPALWSHSLTRLDNPDPHANPLLRRASALLSLQCQDGHKLAFVNHNFPVTAKSAIISTSLDGGPVVAETWTADTDIALQPPDVTAFAARLQGHQILTMSVTWPVPRRHLPSST